MSYFAHMYLSISVANEVNSSLFLLQQDVLFHIEIRSNVSDAIGDELCISTDGRKTWVPLHKFAYVSLMVLESEKE